MKENNQSDDDTKIIKNLGSRWITIIASAIAVGTTIQTFAVFPYRLAAAEEKIKQIETVRSTDHDLLVGIDSEMKSMREEMNRFYRTKFLDHP